MHSSSIPRVRTYAHSAKLASFDAWSWKIETA